MTDAALSALRDRAIRALADYISGTRDSPAVDAEDERLARWWMRKIARGPVIAPPEEK